MGRELLTQKTVIQNVLKDEDDQVIQEGVRMDYTGEPVEEGDALIPQTLDDHFTDLSPEATYKILPVIASPLLDEPLELVSKTAMIRTGSGTLRDQLIRMFNETNGEKWRFKDNWCSDAPLEEWYGISRIEENGRKGYAIDLELNEQTGNVQLSDSTIFFLFVGSKVESLNVSGCRYLKRIGFTNSLKELNVAGCKDLEYIDKELLSGIESLNISDCQFLGDEILTLNYSFPNLRELIAQNRIDIGQLMLPVTLEKLDVAGCSNFDCTEFPLGLRYLNLSGCNAVRLYYGVPFQGLDRLEYLYMKGCNYSQGVQLSCASSLLKEVDISDSKGIQALYITKGAKGLTEVKVTGSEDLETLWIFECPLMNLDLTGCVNLISLTCVKCDLPTLDLTPVAKSLKHLDCQENCLQVLHTEKCFNLETLTCGSNQITQLDLSANTVLESLSCSYMPLRNLNTNGCNQLKYLDCDGCGFSKLNLRHLASGLVQLRCNDNQLSALDLRGFRKLTNLYCKNNQLVELNFAETPLIEFIDCRDNSLTTLDVSNHAFLNHFEFDGNPLQLLRVSKCPSFEPITLQRVIENANLLRVKELVVSGNSNLYRVDFTSLPSSILKLDLSDCGNLTEVNLGGDFVNHKYTTQSLILSDCIRLENLDCHDGDLSNLDITNCTQLKRIEGCRTQLVVLDVTTCSSLSILDCYENPHLSEIHLRTDHVFKSFSCSGTLINRQIPRWLETQFLNHVYNYDVKYSYLENGNYGEDVNVVENDAGWWFAGEPESKQHKPDWWGEE